MTIIENIAIKRRIDVSLTNQNIITYSAVSIFLPYILSAIILAFLSIYILVNKQTRQLIFIHSGSSTMKFFFAYALVIPFIYGNWLGIAAGIGVILTLILGMYLRSVMTKERYEKVLNLICIYSLTSAGYAILEKIITVLDDGRHPQRISAVFFHPNYFGTVVGTVIIICAYKILTKQEHRWFYYLVAGFNVISMYLCKSMFVWVEVFVGVSVLLVVLKRIRLLVIWLTAAVLGGYLIFFMDFDIIPRLSDVEVTVRLRQQIWRLTTEEIRKSPLLGHGFYSFMHLFNRSYRNQVIPHAHSIYLDMLLNFGVIGSILFLWYFIKYYKAVLFKCFIQKETMITALILAVTAAALVHGATDITLLWIQTLPMFFIVLSGLGAFEKTKVYEKRYHTFK